MNALGPIAVGVALACLGSVLPVRGLAMERLPDQLDGVGIQEKLGGNLDKSLPFVDHEGRAVQLGQYFQDGKPVLLTLNYYRCKMLCSLQLNALLNGLRGLGWKPGHDFRIVTVSIDSREGAELAAEKRTSYLKALGMGGDVEWHFLTGNRANIERLADQVGFRFKYDAEQDQWAHAPAIYFLSPTAMITRYLYGLEYAARDLKFALIDAGQGKVGSTLDKIILSCFHFDPSIGAYTTFALGVMRLGGFLTLSLMSLIFIPLWRREKARALVEALP